MSRNWLVGGMLFSLSLLLFANENNEDYRTTLIAHTQLETERQQLFKEGLTNVLEKLTFQSNLATNPEVKQAADHIMSFVDQYAYEGNQLSVQYSPALVKDLVQRLGYAPPNQRSKIMLWCVVDETEGKRLMGEDTDPDMLATLKKEASQTGLTLVLPILDLEDVSRISIHDVWALNMAKVKEASKRYGTETILIGRLHHPSQAGSLGQWKGDWILTNPSENKSYTVQQNSLESVLKEGLAQTAIRPKKSAPSPNTSVTTSKSYLLLIDNLQTGQDFSRVESTLRSLSPVSRVAVAEILGSSAIFEVTLKPNHDSNTLIEAMNLNQYLVEEQMENPSRKVDLAFRFNR